MDKVSLFQKRLEEAMAASERKRQESQKKRQEATLVQSHQNPQQLSLINDENQTPINWQKVSAISTILIGIITIIISLISL